MIYEIHMFIVWHQAIPFLEYIIETITSTLEIIDVIHFTCNKSYAIAIQQKLYNISFHESQEKCKNNNFEDFIIIIVRLKHATYITTSTHWGIARVEKHMYTIKNTLRKKLNLPFCIHSTISKEEAKSDILIITGKASQHYIDYPLWNRRIKEINIMKYTIIITYYQGKNIVQTALKLLCETLKKRMDIEIIVSCDNPKEDITSFEKIDPLSRIRIINTKENGGYSVACNRAVQLARADKIILMDSDIFVTENWLEGLESVYANYTNVGCVSATILNLNNGTVVHWGLSLIVVEVLKPFRDGYLPASLKNTITESPLLTSGCLMVEKNIYTQVSGMDSAFYNGYCDLDFSMKISQLGYNNYVTTNSIVYHRGKIAGQIRIMGEEDTRALFFARWGKEMLIDGREMFCNLLSLNKVEYAPEYIFLNFSKSLYLKKYINCITKVYKCKLVSEYNFKNLALPILLEDILPWDICANSIPFIYFCDNFNLLTQNRHWFFHRNGRGDLLIDRNGNVVSTDTLFQEVSN